MYSCQHSQAFSNCSSKSIEWYFGEPGGRLAYGSTSIAMALSAPSISINSSKCSSCHNLVGTCKYSLAEWYVIRPPGMYSMPNLAHRFAISADTSGVYVSPRSA